MPWWLGSVVFAGGATVMSVRREYGSFNVRERRRTVTSARRRSLKNNSGRRKLGVEVPDPAIVRTADSLTILRKLTIVNSLD
jgi:hypothetical protein